MAFLLVITLAAVMVAHEAMPETIFDAFVGVVVLLSSPFPTLFFGQLCLQFVDLFPSCTQFRSHLLDGVGEL